MWKKNIAVILTQTAAIILAVISILVFTLADNQFFKDIFIPAALACLILFAGASVFLIIYMIERSSLRGNLYSQMSGFVPGGYIEILLDDELTIKTCSEKLMHFMGYSGEEFNAASKGKWLNLISPQDRESALASFRRETSRIQSQIEFSLLCKNHRSVNVLSINNYQKGRKHKTDGILQVKCFVIDTTTLKQMESDRELDAERYRIVAEQSESIIFDYNLRDKTVFINKNFEKKFGFTVDCTANLMDLLKKSDYIHPEDIGHFISLSFTNNPNSYREEEVRLKKASGEYIWCRIRMSTVYNNKNVAARVIGKIIDIDKQMREKALLIEQTRRDFMTGLYNKTATELMISEVLENALSDALCAFIIFDVDNFKRINDDFGHICGDRVLSKIAEDITMIFRSTDILGRIGGDEFVIFIKDLPSEEHAVKKAASILSIIYQNFNMENDGFVVSASMGISFFRKDGETYSELFQKADTALYASKKKGKNAYTVYTPSLTNEMFVKTPRISPGTDSGASALEM